MSSFNPAACILDLEKLGVTLSIKNGRLAATPERKWKKVPPDLQHEMRQNRKQLTQAVRAIERGSGIFRISGRAMALQTQAELD